MAEAMPSTSRVARPSRTLHENNVTMLLEKLKELRMDSEASSADSRIYARIESLLRKEIDDVEDSEYYGVDCDSDEELAEDESDADYFSDDQVNQKTIDYDLDKMFEIVIKRDFKNWSMNTIHHQYKKIADGATGRMQLTRMRNYVKRGSVSSRVDYARLRECVWNEVYSLFHEGVVLHGNDIQFIAMQKAKERNLHNFKASDGWLYYFKKKYNIVDRHIDKVCVARPIDDDSELDSVVNKFMTEIVPVIMKTPPQKIWNADQMGIQLEIPPGRTLAVRGTKKVIRRVQRVNATTHSYTVHIQLNCSGQLIPKLPVALYEPSNMPKKAKEKLDEYRNLQVYWSKSGLMGAEIAKQWMQDVFLPSVEKESVLIIDAWTGYKQMMQLPEIAKKQLKIIQLPAKTTSRLQPADVYFNRPFKNFIRRVCNKVRWMHNDFILAKRENILNILDMVYYQFKATRFENLLKYAWFRSGYTKKHPNEFKTPVQYCLSPKGYVKCEADLCSDFYFLRCAHCERHYCFKDALEHRDQMDC